MNSKSMVMGNLKIIVLITTVWIQLEVHYGLALKVHHLIFKNVLSG